MANAKALDQSNTTSVLCAAPRSRDHVPSQGPCVSWGGAIVTHGYSLRLANGKFGADQCRPRSAFAPLLSPRLHHIPMQKRREVSMRGRGRKSIPT